MKECNVKLQKLWKNNQISILSYLFLENYKRLKLKYEKDNDKALFEKEMCYLYDEANKITNNMFDSVDNLVLFAKENCQPCYELLKVIKSQIKLLYTKNKRIVYHITNKSIDDYPDGVIPRTKNLNQYESELGEWVFGTTEDLDKNAYLARPGSGGMILFDKNSYIYGSDCFKIADNKVKLKQNAYIYKLKINKFTPVVRISLDGQVPFIDFDDEWISNSDINLNEECIEVIEYNDITNLLYNIQIYTSLRKGIGQEIINISNNCDKYSYIRSAIEKGELRYINDELNINNKLFATNNVR